FSPAEFASLPGRPMPPWPDGFPPASHVVDYLAAHEKRYALPAERPVRVTGVTRAGADLVIASTDRLWRARRVISATGTWQQPFWPIYPGAREFSGEQLHTVDYREPTDFTGQQVVIVGGGNSAAQLVAEISTEASTTWVTTRPPRFLPDDVDGRVLFKLASQRAAALAAGHADPDGIAALGDVVMVPEVRSARDRGVLHAQPMFDRLTPDGIAWGPRQQDADAIVWATGFRPALAHLRPLRLHERDGTIAMSGTRVVKEPNLHLLGYGDWTGPGSATILGVGRTAKAAVSRLDLSAQLTQSRRAGPTTLVHATGLS
ncbi:MAG: ArsO family NAD(P)H-dependent flavin-containing monooxygenase, partial [Ornithinimicrobium sp.]